MGGLYAFIAIASIMANIEVLLLVHAFSLDQTLGNVLFASTFLITDLIGEYYGKDKAKRAVAIGVLATLTYLVLSQLWLHYSVLNPKMQAAFEGIFALTPRIVIASLATYVIVQLLDVYLYHRIWERTASKKSPRRALWLRNNASTLTSQGLNSALFTLLAFGGVYDASTLLQIGLSTYAIFIATSLLDTPILYLYPHLLSKGNKAKITIPKNLSS